VRNIDKYRGVTLIELLIAVAIISILGAVAYPSYVNFVVRSDRAESQRELMRLANLQEQYFIDHRVYTNDMKKLGEAADPYITESKNYSIDAIVSGATFDLTATAMGNLAIKDTECTTLTIDELGQKTAESTECWEK